MDSKSDVPVVARRRRKAARQMRESTPDPSLRDGTADSYGSQSQASDEQSGSENKSTGRSTVDSSPQGSVKGSKKSFIERAMDYSSHRNKILSRKDKKLAAAAPRSRSVPRDSEEVPSSPEIFSLLRRAKKSLTSRKPKTDDSSDGGKISDTEVRKRRERIERYQTERSRENEARSTQLQANLSRFNDERRKFELEKLKFLQEKRELDRMRLRRFEKYREEMLEEQRQKLQVELRNREQEEERSKSIEAPILPPAPPTRSKTPVSPGPIKKKLLIIPKTSSASASSSEEERHNTSDEEKLATVRRRFSPRKPKRPRSTKIEHLKVSKTPEPATSPEPESELPSDFPPEVEPVEQELKQEVVQAEEVIIPEVKIEDETVLTQRKVAKPEDDEAKEDTVKEKSDTEKNVNENGIKEMVAVDEKKAIDLKEKKRRRALVVYVEKEDDQFNWTEIYEEWRDLWLDFLDDKPLERNRLRLQVNECLFYFGVLVMLCGVGGVVFRVTEGTFESQYKCGVKRVKRDFIDHLWLSSHNQKEEDWKQTARARLRKFEEELQIAFDAGMKTYSGSTAWNFVNGVIYSLTVVSTIGYGHISPSTTTGRALTIIYAIIGIPIFLIVLADFGKLFTRGIKFLWAYVRRLYYTGSIRKVRKTAQVKEVMKGLNVVYDMVRRPSGENELQPPSDSKTNDQPPIQPSTSNEIPPTCDSPTTPVPETFEIDDEFNLPISVAIFILVAYMLFGATIYFTWENWSFFEAFYFVFISISTIGFGDFVPQHPIYMMCSILYLIFGLALTSMCINVVQLKLSDSFRQASAKIGATIGLQMAEAASLQHSQIHTPIELSGVHTSTPVGNDSQRSPNGDAVVLPDKTRATTAEDDKKESKKD
ncbi:trichohyalin [Sabethes cyaneus]|uniref:trichohyalin n=1 Tax=Sabethes cyaneus TaxID=53552 RepID=UPI00237D9534|nr:trichohyalin [Sabethes cyaneus]